MGMFSFITEYMTQSTYLFADGILLMRKIVCIWHFNKNLLMYGNNINSDILSYRYIEDVLIVRLNNANTILDFDYYPNTLNLELFSRNRKNNNDK